MRTIEDYIPQRPPFVFIDTIDEITDTLCRTRFTIMTDCVLVRDGALSLAGLMENAAQTCATRNGNTIGFIGAVKEMEVKRFPKVGDTIRTEARVVQEVMNIALVECSTWLEDECIATTTLKIATME